MIIFHELRPQGRLFKKPVIQSRSRDTCCPNFSTGRQANCGHMLEAAMCIFHVQLGVREWLRSAWSEVASEDHSPSCSNGCERTLALWCPHQAQGPMNPLCDPQEQQCAERDMYRPENQDPAFWSRLCHRRSPRFFAAFKYVNGRRQFN